MPNLKHLPEELEEPGVEPRRIRMPGQLYDSMVADAEESIEENHKVGRSEAPTLPVAKTVGQARRC